MLNRKQKLEKAATDVGKIIDRIKELVEEEPNEPYVNDAQSFLQQGIVCLEKQILTETD